MDVVAEPGDGLDEQVVRHWLRGRAPAEVHQEVARLLSDPGAARVGRDAQQVDAAGGVLYDEQHR
jgi:hypothetical protein